MTRIVRGPEREGKKNRLPFMISLCLHGALIAATGIMLALSEDIRDQIDRSDVFWIQDTQKKEPISPRLQPKAIKIVKEPASRRLQPKVTKIKKDREIALKDPDKLMEQAKNKRAEVERLSDRKLMKDALNIDFEKTKQLPDIMTKADLPTDVTGLNRPQAALGRTDGIGDVTARARVRGKGLGSFTQNNEGLENGLLGSGGGGDGDDGGARGTGDGVFMGSFVYVLNISVNIYGADIVEAEERNKKRARALLDRYSILFRDLLKPELPHSQ